MNLHFELTCQACPEQYDVVDLDADNKIVAYVRLRWGVLRCDVPDVGGETIFRHEFDDGLQGMFWSEEEREHYLGLVLKAIEKHYASFNEWKLMCPKCASWVLSPESTSCAEIAGDCYQWCWYECTKCGYESESEETINGDHDVWELVYKKHVLVV